MIFGIVLNLAQIIVAVQLHRITTLLLNKIRNISSRRENKKMGGAYTPYPFLSIKTTFIMSQYNVAFICILCIFEIFFIFFASASCRQSYLHRAKY